MKLINGEKWEKELTEAKIFNALMTARRGSPFSLYRKGVMLTTRNISWGFLDSEADVLTVDGKMRLLECEIKISMSDFRREFKKTKYENFDNNNKIYEKYFCLPRYIFEKNKTEILDAATKHKFGVLTVHYFNNIECQQYAPSGTAYIVTPGEFYCLARLVCFRQK